MVQVLAGVAGLGQEPEVLQPGVKTLSCWVSCKLQGGANGAR